MAPLLAMMLMLPSLSQADTQQDVVIVGAGSAGLYAAFTLENLGFNVRVLEAKDRTGGRVHTVSLDDPSFWPEGVSEAGAEEVESTKNNFYQDDVDAAFPGRIVPTLTYDKNGQVVFESTWDGDGTTVRYPGAPQEVYDYWDFYDSHIGDSHAAGIDMEEDLADHGSGKNNSINRGDDVWHMYVATPGGAFQARLKDMEMRSAGRQEALWPYGDSTNTHKEVGYMPTLNALYFDSLVGPIDLLSPVTVIDTQTGPRPFAVADGENHFADAIIVTVSAGVINAGIITFVPPLPASKTDAYAKLNMNPGSSFGTKVMMKFDSVFWNPDVEYTITNPGAECWNQGFRQPAVGSGDDQVWACLIGPDAIEDDLDGLEMGDLTFVDANGDGIPDVGRFVFFTLSGASPSLAPLTTNDILVSTAPGFAFGLYASGIVDIGLLPGDVIDAHALFDNGVGGGFPFGVPNGVLDLGDVALFSLAAGSPSLGAGEESVR